MPINADSTIYYQSTAVESRDCISVQESLSLRNNFAYTKKIVSICCGAAMKSARGMVAALLLAVVLMNFCMASEDSEHYEYGFLKNKYPKFPNCEYSPCAKVYCINSTYRWSCQTSKFYAEVEYNCTYYKTTEKIYNEYSPDEKSKANRTVMLPYCGTTSRPSQKYKYAGYYESFCPTEFPVTSKTKKYLHWRECA